MTKNMIWTPNEKILPQRQLWIAWGLSAVSGVLIAASMPNFDMNILGWVALVPLLLAIQYMPDKSAYALALPVLWSAIEFVKYIAPIVEDLWVVSLAAHRTKLKG